MLILTTKKDGKKADYKFKSVMIEKCKEVGIGKGNKINDYEFRDDADRSAIIEKCNFTTVDNKTYEFWIEWGYQSILTEIDSPIIY